MPVERASRLRRYLRKDYTQVVRFPVEIVGRDGHVRRYSFDDSVRLYQRRVHSAAMRYDDPALVEAEVQHCRRRIDQLRRSYLEHHGWGALRDGKLRGVFAGPLAAEVAAFLKRSFDRPDEAAPLALSALPGGPAECLFVQSPDDGRGYVLYAWRLDPEGPFGAADDFRVTVRRLASAPDGEGVERLFAVHESADIALALAGAGEWDGAPHGFPDVDGDERDEDRLQAGLRALYDGHPLDALRVLEAGMEAEPGRVVLAWWAAVVGLLSDQVERAEFAARYGLLQHPGDTRLTYLLGVALSRTGRLDEARTLVSGGRGAHLAVLDALLALERGRWAYAWSRLREVAGAQGHDEPAFVVRAADGIRSRVLRHAAALGAAGGLAAGAITLSVLGLSLLGGAVAAGGVVVAVASTASLRSQARAVLAGRPGFVARLVSLDVVPRDRPGDGVQ